MFPHGRAHVDMSSGSCFVCLGCRFLAVIGIMPRCIHMSCSRLPLTGSVVLAIVLVAIILFNLGFLRLPRPPPSCPFASAHHTHRFVVGFCFILLALGHIVLSVLLLLRTRTGRIQRYGSYRN